MKTINETIPVKIRAEYWLIFKNWEIGRQINVSRERVRQLEAKAILKLRVMTTHQKAA